MNGGIQCKQVVNSFNQLKGLRNRNKDQQHSMD